MGMIVAAGGGNEVGASCYYLEIGRHKLLLDCGLRLVSGNKYPDFGFLERNFLNGWIDLDTVVISHAHYDHLAGLPYLTDAADSLRVLANPVTCTIAPLALEPEAKQNHDSPRLVLKRAVSTDNAVRALEPVPYNRPWEKDGLKVTLYPAGHIPGAAMALIEADGERLLYTGDFSAGSYHLTAPYFLPEELGPIDALLLSGTNAYKPNKSGGYGISAMIRGLQKALPAHRFLQYHTQNLTKGVEVAYYLAEYIRSQELNAKVFLSERVNRFADCCAEFGVYPLSDIIRPVSELFLADCPYRIVVRQSGDPVPRGFFAMPDVPFSLHASHDDIADLIRRVQAKKVFLVHAEPGFFLPTDLQEAAEAYGGELGQVYNNTPVYFRHIPSFFEGSL